MLGRNLKKKRRRGRRKRKKLQLQKVERRRPTRQMVSRVEMSCTTSGDTDCLQNGELSPQLARRARRCGHFHFAPYQPEINQIRRRKAKPTLSLNPNLHLNPNPQQLMTTGVALLPRARRRRARRTTLSPYMSRSFLWRRLMRVRLRMPDWTNGAALPLSVCCIRCARHAIMY